MTQVTANEPEHCAFGLISRSGWAIFDDSRSPILVDDWVHPQLHGTCPVPPVASLQHAGKVAGDALRPCFGAGAHAGGLKNGDQHACESAGVLLIL